MVASFIRKKKDHQFKIKSEKIRKPRTLLKKYFRVVELERLADDELLDANERHELMRLRKQLKGFRYVVSHIPRDQLDSLSDEDRRRVLNDTPQHYMLPAKDEYPDPRKMFFGVRPGRLREKDEELVNTFRIMQKIRKVVEDHIEEFKKNKKFTKETVNG